MRSAYAGLRLLVDNSAFAAVSRHDALLEDWGLALEADQLVLCAPFLLEALYSARNAREYEQLYDELTGSCEQARFDDETWRLAEAAQRQLARHAACFHRIPHVDYLVAAGAHQHGLGVLHYDGDYDRLHRHSGLLFDSCWIAPPSSLDEGRADALRGHRRALAHGLGQFAGDRAREVCDAAIDTVWSALKEDGHQLPDRPRRAAPR